MILENANPLPSSRDLGVAASSFFYKPYLIDLIKLLQVDKPWFYEDSPGRLDILKCFRACIMLKSYQQIIIVNKLLILWAKDLVRFM